MCLTNECSIKFCLLQESLKAGGTLHIENISKDQNLQDPILSKCNIFFLFFLPVNKVKTAR